MDEPCPVSGEEPPLVRDKGQKMARWRRPDPNQRLERSCAADERGNVTGFCGAMRPGSPSWARGEADDQQDNMTYRDSARAIRIQKRGTLASSPDLSSRIAWQLEHKREKDACHHRDNLFQDIRSWWRSLTVNYGRYGLRS